MEHQQLEHIVHTYGSSIYRMAYARTGSHADAQDVMQETFLRLVRTEPVFESETHCKAWLLRVAANCVNDVFRSPWRQTQPLHESIPTPAQPETGGVLEAVLALPAKYRLPVHLYYYEGLSVADISAILGTSQSVVKTRLFRARGMLRLELEGGTEHV